MLNWELIKWSKIMDKANFAGSTTLVASETQKLFSIFTFHKMYSFMLIGS